jgi:nitrate reductase NapE component
METNFAAILKGTGLWAIALVVPLLLWYIDSSEFKTFVFLLYPVMISMFSRIGWFWVRPEILAYSSIIAFAYGSLLNRIPAVDKALSDPKSDKAVSAVTLTSIVLFFLLSVALMGMYYKPLYNMSNFV